MTEKALGAPPWHLWGGAQSLNISEGNSSLSGQVARVSYKRPETWTWFCGIVLVGGETLTGAELKVQFDLVIGIGRSQITIPSWGEMEFLWPGAVPVPTTRWATKWPAPQLKYGGDPPGFVPISEDFPAQDIQLNVRAQFQANLSAENCIFEAHGYFAPRSHQRPDWFQHQFFGGERDGH